MIDTASGSSTASRSPAEPQHHAIERFNLLEPFQVIAANRENGE